MGQFEHARKTMNHQGEESITKVFVLRFPLWTFVPVVVKSFKLTHDQLETLLDATSPAVFT
jgi:hypothetical protein